MDSISSIASINRLIQARRLKQQQKPPSKRSSKGNKAEQDTSTSRPSHDITAQISKLTQKQQMGPDGIKLLVEGILVWKFGKGAMNDPLIKKNAQAVMDAILNDKKSKKTTETLIKDLLSHKKK